MQVKNLKRYTLVEILEGIVIYQKYKYIYPKLFLYEKCLKSVEILNNYEKNVEKQAEYLNNII